MLANTQLTDTIIRYMDIICFSFLGVAVLVGVIKKANAKESDESKSKDSSD